LNILVHKIIVTNY